MHAHISIKIAHTVAAITCMIQIAIVFLISIYGEVQSTCLFRKQSYMDHMLSKFIVLNLHPIPN